MRPTPTRTQPATTLPDNWDVFAARKHAAVTYGSLEVVIDTLFNLLSTSKRNRDDQVSALEARIVQLEQQPPSPRYAGVFEQGKAYARGSLTTRAGGLWLALEDTTQTPGRSEQWRLVVKSGETPR